MDLIAAAAAISLKDLLAIGGGVGAIVGAVWFLARRLSSIEVGIAQLGERHSASEAAHKVTAESVRSTERRVEQLQEDLHALREDLQVLRLENQTLQKELARHERIYHLDPPRP